MLPSVIVSEIDQQPVSEVHDAVDVATRAIAGLGSVEEVLQVIVDQIRPLVGARYAALGIVDASGVIEAFITSGEYQRRFGPYEARLVPVTRVAFEVNSGIRNSELRVIR